MQLELGPIAVEDVISWTRFARRLICEMKVDPADLAGVASPDLLSAWADMIDNLEHHATSQVSQAAQLAILDAPTPPDTAPTPDMFRWTGSIDVELAEYLLHGLHRCVHSESLLSRITPQERTKQAPFTLHLVQSFIDGLTAEGLCHLQLVDQVRTTLGQLLDH